MNYEKIYNNIVNYRKQNSFNGYTETHHIVPVSLGGANTKDNLVKLSAKEHFICHLLLTKIHLTGPNHFKMIRAFLMMQVCGKGQQRFFSSRNYQFLKEKYSSFIKETTKGFGNSQYGTKWISNPDSLVSLKIQKNELVPDGFYLGRNLKWKNCNKCDVKHLLFGFLCLNCKTLFKNRPKKEKTKSTSSYKRKQKIEKSCIGCNKLFLTIEGIYCSVQCLRKNGNSAVARKVKDDFGNVFESLTSAAKYYNVTVEAIRYRIKIKKYEYL